MQAIVTKYLCPTNHRGARVKASCEAGTVTLPWDHAMDAVGNHRAAAAALCKRIDASNAKKYGTDDKCSWSARVWGWGSMPDGGYCHIACSEKMTVERQ